MRRSGPRESEIQASILSALRLVGLMARRVNTHGVPLHGGRTGFRKAPNRGMSDIHTILPPNGRACWIEVKRPGAKPTPDQDRFMDEVNAAGGLAFVATSAGDALGRLEREGISMGGLSLTLVAEGRSERGGARTVSGSGAGSE